MSDRKRFVIGSLNFGKMAQNTLKSILQQLINTLRNLADDDNQNLSGGFYQLSK